MSESESERERGRTGHQIDIRLLCLDELPLTIQIKSQLLLDSILFLFVPSKEQRSHDDDSEYAEDQQESSNWNIAVCGNTIHEVTLDAFGCSGVGVLSRGTVRALDCATLRVRVKRTNQSFSILT